jgi:hypothetical protein
MTAARSNREGTALDGNGGKMRLRRRQIPLSTARSCKRLRRLGSPGQLAR